MPNGDNDDVKPTWKVSLVGKMEEFLLDEDMECYLERLETFFEVNEIVEGKRVGVLLTVIGSNSYEVVRQLAFPQKPKELTYADLVK